jgi:hypothetical protein
MKNRGTTYTFELMPIETPPISISEEIAGKLKELEKELEFYNCKIVKFVRPTAKIVSSTRHKKGNPTRIPYSAGIANLNTDGVKFGECLIRWENSDVGYPVIETPSGNTYIFAHPAFQTIFRQSKPKVSSFTPTPFMSLKPFDVKKMRIVPRNKAEATSGFCFYPSNVINRAGSEAEATAVCISKIESHKSFNKKGEYLDDYVEERLSAYKLVKIHKGEK